MDGVMPLGTFGKAKVGSCGVCGVVGPLTKTHVPPRRAGNDGSYTFAVTVPDADGLWVTRGHARDGRAAPYLLCQPCNHFAGAHYDEAFDWFWEGVRRQWAAVGASPTAGITATLEADDPDPGAFVRCLLSGMMGLHPPLREKYPQLQGAVQHGSVIGPPGNLHLLMALTVVKTRRVKGGGSRAMLTPQGLVTLGELYVEIVRSPLYLALVDDAARRAFPDVLSILPWLRDPPGVRRSMSLPLPILPLNRHYGAPMHDPDARLASFLGPDGELVVQAPPI